jgi:hypothetical protein
MQPLSTVPLAKTDDSHIATSLVAEFGPVGRCAAMSEVYMTNRAATLLLIVSASIIAGGSIVSILVSTAVAADECLTKPTAGTHPGQHWYYRIDRSTKRQCWYLRDKDDASAQAAAPAPSEKTASLDRSNDSSLNRSTADAYAALSSPGVRFEADAQIPPVTQTPSDARADDQDQAHDASPAAEQSPVASRWPDSTGVLAAAIERPADSSFAVASATPDRTTDAAPAGSEMSPSPADTSSTAVSLQMPLLAAFGALAFSGLTGGAIYFARARRRPQLDDVTGRWPGWSPPDDAYRLYAPVRESRPVNSPRGADARPVHRLTDGSSDSGQEIAQLLARFANQAEAER